jgi:hypothetical protein
LQIGALKIKSNGRQIEVMLNQRSQIPKKRVEKKKKGGSNSNKGLGNN